MIGRKIKVFTFMCLVLLTISSFYLLIPTQKTISYANNKFKTIINSTVINGKTIYGKNCYFEVTFDTTDNVSGFDTRDIKINSGKIQNFKKKNIDNNSSSNNLNSKIIYNNVYTFEITNITTPTLEIVIPEDAVETNVDRVKNFNQATSFKINVEQNKKAKATLIITPQKDVYETGDTINYTIFTDNVYLNTKDSYISLTGPINASLALTSSGKDILSFNSQTGSTEFTGKFTIPYGEGTLNVNLNAKDLGNNAIDMEPNNVKTIKISKKEIQMVITKNANGNKLTFTFNDNVLIDNTKIIINNSISENKFKKSSDGMSYTYELASPSLNDTIVKINKGAIKTLGGAELSEGVYSVKTGSDGNIENLIINFNNRLSIEMTTGKFITLHNELVDFISANKNLEFEMKKNLKLVIQKLAEKYSTLLTSSFSRSNFPDYYNFTANNDLINLAKLKPTMNKLLDFVGITNKDLISYINLDFTTRNEAKIIITDEKLSHLKANSINIKLIKEGITYIIPCTIQKNASVYKINIRSIKEDNVYTSYHQIGLSHKISLYTEDVTGKSREVALNTPIDIVIPINMFDNTYYEFIRGAHKDSSGNTNSYNFNITSQNITGRLSRGGTYFFYKSQENQSSESEKEIITTFKDIEKHWAKEYIMMLVNEKITSGVTSTTFEPSSNVTRAQAATFMYRTCKLTEVTFTGKFRDVPQGKWYTPYIETASANSIISGYTDGTFKPENYLTRQEMIVMIMKAYEKNTGVKVADLSKDAPSFKDENKISSWALPSIKAASKLGFISGDKNGNFNPQNNITRAEVSKIIALYLTKIRTV